MPTAHICEDSGRQWQTVADSVLAVVAYINRQGGVRSSALLNSLHLPPLGVDALAHTLWPWALLYAFLTLQLILPLLERVRQEELSLILVAPENHSALWFPEPLSRTAQLLVSLRKWKWKRKRVRK